MLAAAMALALVVLAGYLGLGHDPGWDHTRAPPKASAPAHAPMHMIFRDDETPANFTTLEHMAQNLIRKAPDNYSLRLKRKVAAWDDDFLASLIAA
jgi:hypothetical protein